LGGAPRFCELEDLTIPGELHALRLTGVNRADRRPPDVDKDDATNSSIDGFESSPPDGSVPADAAPEDDGSVPRGSLQKGQIRTCCPFREA
jgi:hypothetical protein